MEIKTKKKYCGKSRINKYLKNEHNLTDKIHNKHNPTKNK